MSTTTTALALFAAVACASVLGQDFGERPATNEPQFVSQGGNRVVREGEDIDLPCEVHDLGEFVILWKFNRSQVLFAGNLRIHRDDRISRDDQKGSLVIRNFRPENAGEYSCQISTNPPKDIVYNVAVIGPPQIRASNAQVVVKRNDSFTLRCDAEADKIEWRRGQRLLQAVGPQLHVQRAQPSDAGVVECVAQNAIGSSSQTFKVHVLHEPEVRADADLVHAPVGHRLAITCHVSAEPAAEVQWRRSDNRRVEPNSVFRLERSNASSVLVIANVTSPALYDNYTCFANNSLGAAHSTVHVTGRPSRPAFTSAPLSGRDSGYLLEWRLESQSPITAYDLRFRRVDAGDSERWQHVRVEPSAPANESPLRSDRFVLENLAKDGNYEVVLEAQNAFGSTLSEVFSFVTSDASSVVSCVAFWTTCVFASALVWRR